MLSEQLASAKTVATSPVKLSCKSVWKVFGHGAEGLFHNNRRPSAAVLAEGPFIPAVCDVTLDVIEGEIFIIMGLSGSGKSTLVRCMTRLIEPTAGEVLFDARDLLKAPAAELMAIRRHKMGMVFQNFALLPHRTVLGNVVFPLEIQGVARKQREKHALKAIELVGLTGRENDYPRELSGGQQQRVGIARSLVVEPDVWFLDEPFSALDPLIRREMQDEFLRLQSVLHKTIVFITHDFEEAIRLADRIAIMKDGEIIQIGSSEELVMHPATAYVEEFTRGIPRAKVLSAAAIADPPGAGPFSGTVSASMKIEALVHQVVNAETGAVFRVADAAGQTVGQLSRNAVIAVLAAVREDT